MERSTAAGNPALMRSGRPDGAYVFSLHTDRTPYMEDCMPAGLAAEVAGRHHMLVVLWRSLDEASPVMRHPLALLHPGTLELGDVAFVENPPAREYAHAPGCSTWCNNTCNPDAAFPGDGIGKSISMTLAWSTPQHTWLYFPRARHDEVIAFRQSDTREADPLRRQVVHTAFADPTCPPDAPDRRSVEVRVLCIFGEETADARARRREHFRERFPAPTAGWAGNRWERPKL